MGIAIERGRTFTTPERESSGVAIVSASAARHFWPDADPIGRRLKMSTASQGRAPEVHEVAVVGVARDVHTANASRPDPLFVYLPASDSEPSEILVRTAGAGSAAIGAVRTAVGSVDRQLLASLRIVSLDSLIREQQGLTETLATSAMLLAALALVLALIGIYGVMSFLVAQRVQEIGIRIALGARRGDVARLMLADGLRPVAAGAAAGLILAAGVSLVARAILIAPSSPDLLFGVGALDPVTLLAVCSVLGVTASLACLAPTLRATGIDPMTALRAE
jgi:ABC-type antimicrobial peptide transport system permease subunit